MTEAPAAAPVRERELRVLKGVGPRRAQELARAGLRTADALLHRFPIRYEDRSQRLSSPALKPDTTVAVSGEVVSCSLRRTRRRGFSLFEMLVRDEAGMFRVVFMNQPFLQDVFIAGPVSYTHLTLPPIYSV